MLTNAKNTKNRQQTRTDPIKMAKNINISALYSYFLPQKALNNGKKSLFLMFP